MCQFITKISKKRERCCVLNDFIKVKKEKKI